MKKRPLQHLFNNSYHLYIALFLSILLFDCQKKSVKIYFTNGHWIGWTECKGQANQNVSGNMFGIGRLCHNWHPPSHPPTPTKHFFLLYNLFNRSSPERFQRCLPSHQFKHGKKARTYKWTWLITDIWPNIQNMDHWSQMLILKMNMIKLFLDVVQKIERRKK